MLNVFTWGLLKISRQKFFFNSMMMKWKIVSCFEAKWWDIGSMKPLTSNNNGRLVIIFAI